MPININDPEYTKAEKEFHEASSPEERLIALRKMISHAPKHKGGENLRQQLTTRRKKLEQEIEKKKKSGKGSQIGIRKEDMQAILIGNSNSGKSSILKLLTNAHPKISENKFSTTHPEIGMMPYQGMQIQLIENPSIDSEYYDKGIVFNTDTVLITITDIKEMPKIESKLKTEGKKIIIFNKSDLLSENQKRKLSATLNSKYRNYPFILFSSRTQEGIEELKEKLFQNFGKIRVYTKEPGKEKSNNPIVLPPESTVKEVAEKILKGFSQKVKQIKIWGPSSKFPAQIVSLKHKLKDLDVVEFKTK